MRLLRPTAATARHISTSGTFSQHVSWRVSFNASRSRVLPFQRKLFVEAVLALTCVQRCCPLHSRIALYSRYFGSFLFSKYGCWQPVAARTAVLSPRNPDVHQHLSTLDVARKTTMHGLYVRLTCVASGDPEDQWPLQKWSRPSCSSGLSRSTLEGGEAFSSHNFLRQVASLVSYRLLTSPVSECE